MAPARCKERAYRLVAAAALLAALAPPAASTPLFTIMQRETDPPRLRVLRLRAAGELEAIEIEPSGHRVVEVRRGRVAAAAALIARLEESGFFARPDSSLLPPRGLHVVGEQPLVVSIETAIRARTITTGAPRVPAPLAAALDTLRAAGRAAALAESCVVCFPRVSRPTPRRTAQASEASPEPGIRSLVAALSGPFPVALPAAEGEELRRRYGGRTFTLGTRTGAYLVECITWSPEAGNRLPEHENEP
jgi:hypothetical protein